MSEFSPANHLKNSFLMKRSFNRILSNLCGETHKCQHCVVSKFTIRKISILVKTLWKKDLEIGLMCSRNVTRQSSPKSSVTNFQRRILIAPEIKNQNITKKTKYFVPSVRGPRRSSNEAMARPWFHSGTSMESNAMKIIVDYHMKIIKILNI